MQKKPTVFLESHHLKNQFFGFGQFNYHLIDALRKNDFNNLDIHLLVRDKKKWRSTFGSAYTYKQYHSLHRYPFARIKKKYDLWHSLNQNTRIEPYNDLPYLLTVHNITFIKDIETYKEQEVHQRFQKKLNRSSFITYISEYAKTSTHQFFDVPDVPEKVIYNGNTIQPLEIPQDYNLRPNSKPFLFTIGECTARKNFKSLVHMLEHLPDYELVIAGKDSTKEAQEIKDLIEKKGLSNRISLPGKISELDKQWYYTNCKAFVFPSLREGFGLPVIEAMHFGKPVFTSNNTSLPEIGGKVAFYWNNYDPEEMATVLKNGISKIDSDHMFIEKSKERAASFSWNTAATEYLEIYNAILGKF